ncbi:MAG TPA: DUF5677 domain-containing protein [Rhizomicrobium sp.]|nr:DUF5677 domain-containing protein [Rhizomicrobium sp.]
MADAEKEKIDLESLLTNYGARVECELNARLEAWPPDFACIHVHEVVGSMLARQATLAKQIAMVPLLWNGHTAPILLRAMADVYINIAWLLIDPSERCQRFISYGLGQAKLELEHQRAERAKRELTPENSAMMDAYERWIETQRACFLQDVDLGRWAGLSVRQMAEEAECIDFYNLVYTPFSACAHSMWHHIGKYNLRRCTNPLHRYHGRPVSPESEPDLHYLLLAAKYWAKTLGTFDTRVGIEVACESARDALLAAIS